MAEPAYPWLTMPIFWEHTGDGEVPYRAYAGGQKLLIRVNDFPDQPLYTLFADGVKVTDLEDWPSRWTRAPIPGHLLDMLAKTQERDHDEKE